jgi:hypothetical protein
MDTGTFIILTHVTTNVGNGLRVLDDTHLHWSNFMLI